MSSGASPEHVARRIARSLQGMSRVWIAPELMVLGALVGSERLADDDAEVAVLLASQLGEAGDIHGPRGAPRAERIWAVLDASLFNGSPPLEKPCPCIVRRCAAPVARVERAFSRLGVLDVTEQGLVVVELARGVSATNMQKLAEPTLKISSRVDLMRDRVPGKRDLGVERDEP